MAHWPYYGGFGPTFLAINWTFCAVCAIQIIARIIGVYVLPNKHNVSSLIFACLAWLLSLIGVIFGTYGMYYGLGNDIEQYLQIPSSILSKAFFDMWITVIAVCYSSFFGRLSAALFMFTILGPTHKPGRRAISFIMAVNGITYIVFTALLYTACRPRAKVWNPFLPGTCNLDLPYDWIVFAGGWAAFADASIALYPAYVLYHLQMRLTTKFLVGGLMSLGLLAALCNVFRNIYLKDIKLLNVKNLYHFAVWGPVEAWVVLMAANFAPLYPLFCECARRNRRIFSSYKASNVWLQRLSNTLVGSTEKSKITHSNGSIVRNSINFEPLTIDMTNNVIMKQPSFEVDFCDGGRESDSESEVSDARDVNYPNKGTNPPLGSMRLPDTL